MTRGFKLKQLRNIKNLSQVEAARYLGISKQTLFKYENDIITNIPSDVIERIAKLYDTTPAYIMGWDPIVEYINDTYSEDKQMSSEDHELLDRYHNVSPETRNSIDLLIEADLRKHGLLD